MARGKMKQPKKEELVLSLLMLWNAMDDGATPLDTNEIERVMNIIARISRKSATQKDGT